VTRDTKFIDLCCGAISPRSLGVARVGQQPRVASARASHGTPCPPPRTRSQAARRAALFVALMLGDLAGLPLLKNVPCSHCEQISTHGIDAAAAPNMPGGTVTRYDASFSAVGG